MNNAAKRIYVASSWRNNIQPQVVKFLRAAGYEVYDFKNPRPGDNGFHWSEIDPEWKGWTPQQFIKGLGHPIAERGFASDMTALRECDICVLVLPCGRSAHLEAGWAAGAGKKVFIYIPEQCEPELMYKMTDGQCADINELVSLIEQGGNPMQAELDECFVDLPCKPGDTVYMILPADCKSGECPDIDTDACGFSSFHAPTEEVYQCRGRHALVKEIEVYEICAAVDEDGTRFIINECYEVMSAEQIFPTIKAAEAALKEYKERKCRVCGCSQYNACPGGCYWVEDDLCSKCAEDGALAATEP